MPTVFGLIPHCFKHGMVRLRETDRGYWKQRDAYAMDA